MRKPPLVRRNAPPARQAPATHLFAVGQIVRLKSTFGTQQTTEVYRVTGTLPPKANSLQYRIRSDDERYERVTTEDNLEPVREDNPTLIEKTFGAGQGTETRQSTNSRTEAEQSFADRFPQETSGEAQQADSQQLT